MPLDRDKKLEIENALADQRRLDEILESADRRTKAGLYNLTESGKPIIHGSETDRDSKEHRHTNPQDKAKHGRDAYYFFPESYNELRRELSTHWPNLWKLVQWRMAYRPEEFVEIMNSALDVAVVFDTEMVDFISSTYLKLLKAKRGVS